MNREFIPYEQALELKELGFNEPCFSHSEHRKKCEYHEQPGGCPLNNLHCGYPDCTFDKSITPVPLPTFSQAFRWFREKYELAHNIHPITYECYVVTQINPVIHYVENSNTYEEAELACLKKLIEIAKSKRDQL